MKKTFKLTLALTVAALLVMSTGCSDMVSSLINGSASSASSSTSSSSKTESSETTTGSSTDNEPFTNEQIRALAFGAVLSQRNEMTFTENLYGLPDSYRAEEAAVLEESWGIVDETTAIDTLEWLRDEGHARPTEENYGYDELYDIVLERETELSKDDVDYLTKTFPTESSGITNVRKQFIDEYGYTEAELDNITTLTAWDYDRMINVARWSYGAGFITEEQAWKYINEAAELGAKDYNSWREYLAACMIGRTIWSQSDNLDSSDETVIKALLSDDSVYNQVSFK